MRYHGVDLHKKYVTVSVRDETGAQIAFMGREPDIAGYVGRLAAEDVVALEASAGALHWAERIGEQGARCVVLDAYRFRIIRDSWQKTDRHDATNLSLALWLAQTSGQVKLPVVWQPSATVRELRIRRVPGLRPASSTTAAGTVTWFLPAIRVITESLTLSGWRSQIEPCRSLCGDQFLTGLPGSH